MLKDYELNNKKRDLSDLFTTVVQKMPRFIGLFGSNSAAGTKHEWLEDVLSPRSVTASSVSSLTVTASASDVNAVKVGTILRISDDQATFKVTSKPTATTFVVALENAFGSTTTTPADGDVLDIISTPQSQETENGAGEGILHALTTSYNYTQILRKEVEITATALAASSYGNVDNSINAQVLIKLNEIAKDLNRMALYGNRVEASASKEGQAGGLYYFGTQTGGLSVTPSGTPSLSSSIVNDAAELILAKGGSPNAVIYSISQARALSSELASQVRVAIDNRGTGQYVAQITNDVTGQPMTIMAEYDMLDSDAWVLDTSGLAISSYRPMSDSDTTSKGFDGVTRSVISELTFEFKNPLERTCLIKALG